MNEYRFTTDSETMAMILNAIENEMKGRIGQDYRNIEKPFRELLNQWMENIKN